MVFVDYAVKAKGGMGITLQAYFVNVHTYTAVKDDVTMDIVAEVR